MILLSAVFAAALASGSPSFGQTTEAEASAEVRRTLEAARKEVDAYTAGGGAAGAANHPAIKWDAALWVYRGRYPASEAAALATSEAIRMLVHAEIWERAFERIDSLDADDRAWERLASTVYEAGIARKDLPSAITRLSRVAAATTNTKIKALALLVLGRAHRRQGDFEAAMQSLQAAKAAGAGTPLEKEADGLIYEVRHLNPGLPAPEISATTRSGRAITLADFRGQAVVLVFWGST